MSDKPQNIDTEQTSSIVELIAQLDKKLSSVVKYIAETKSATSQDQDWYSSPEVNKIAEAVAKAQGEFRSVMCNRENPYFKSNYADIDAIMNAIRTPLSKNGLSVWQPPCSNENGTTILHTRIIHSSGQWIASRLRLIPPKNDMQSLGSTMSYVRRYAISSMLGITVSDDIIDDDAERAMISSRDIIAKGTALNRKYNPKEQSHDVITKEQLDELEYELAEYPDIAEQVLDGLKLQSLANMPKTKYQLSINRIREIKNMRNNGAK